MESISRQLSRWVAALQYDALPPTLLDRARGVTLQALSSALLGYAYPEAQQAIRTIEDEEAGASGNATVLVDGRHLTRAGAAFVNAEMMLCGGKWDAFQMVTHPGWRFCRPRWP